MTYVALLRGINVGGNRKVEMAKLKQTVERLGFDQVKTFIASGNVVFVTDSADKSGLTKQIEAAIEQDFGFPVATLLRSLPEISRLVNELPANWVNDKATKCDVWFLWPESDKPKVVEQIAYDPAVEDVRYLPGAVGWRIERDKASRSKVLRVAGSKLYQQITVRNPNTVRKIYDLMLAADQAEALTGS